MKKIIKILEFGIFLPFSVEFTWETVKHGKKYIDIILQGLYTSNSNKENHVKIGCKIKFVN